MNRISGNRFVLYGVAAVIAVYLIIIAIKSWQISDTPVYTLQTNLSEPPISPDTTLKHQETILYSGPIDNTEVININQYSPNTILYVRSLVWTIESSNLGKLVITPTNHSMERLVGYSFTLQSINSTYKDHANWQFDLGHIDSSGLLPYTQRTVKLHGMADLTIDTIYRFKLTEITK